MLLEPEPGEVTLEILGHPIKKKHHSKSQYQRHQRRSNTVYPYRGISHGPSRTLWIIHLSLRFPFRTNCSPSLLGSTHLHKPCPTHDNRNPLQIDCRCCIVYCLAMHENVGELSLCCKLTLTALRLTCLGRQLDEEQHQELLQPSARPHFQRKELSRHKQFRIPAQKLLTRSFCRSVLALLALARSRASSRCWRWCRALLRGHDWPTRLVFAGSPSMSRVSRWRLLGPTIADPVSWLWPPSSWILRESDDRHRKLNGKPSQTDLHFCLSTPRFESWRCRDLPCRKFAASVNESSRPRIARRQPAVIVPHLTGSVSVASTGRSQFW